MIVKSKYVTYDTISQEYKANNLKYSWLYAKKLYVKKCYIFRAGINEQNSCTQMHKNTDSQSYIRQYLIPNVQHVSAYVFV
jgi:hypothetical protein